MLVFIYHMTKDFSFLNKELKNELTNLFGRGVNTKRIISYWNKTVKIYEKQAKEIKEKNLTPGKYREESEDIGVYMASEWEDVQATKLLNDGELKTREFYEGVIKTALITHKRVGQGRLNHYKSPIAYSVLKLETQGSMTPEEFDQTMTDLVNFLVYASDPESLHRKAIGWWILGFLIIFVLFGY